MHSIALSLAIGVLVTASSYAADPPPWHFIRGVNFDGHSAETGLANAWPAEGPPVLWTRTLGQGYSSFVAWDDRVATQYQSLSGQYVVCLDAATGDTIWEHWYDWPFDPAGLYPGPRATPTYHDGKLYFAAPSGLIGCLNAKTGKVIWQDNVLKRFDSGTGFGFACSPVLIEGKVLLPVGGEGASMVALDATSGKVIWHAGNDVASYTPAYPIDFRGQPLVLGYLENALVCHNRETGELVWRHELSAGYDEHSAWPIYREPHLWLSSPFRAGCELLELTGDPDTPLKLLWHNESMSNDIASSVLVDGAIYGFDVRDVQTKAHRATRGQFRCLDFLTGEEHWSIGSMDRRREAYEPSDAGRRVGHATVLYADDKLILLNDTGELILARASSSSYQELGRARVLEGDICWTQPALNKGRLFVRNHSRAVCLFAGEPSKLSAESRQAALTVAEIPTGRYVDLTGMVLGVEPEYAFDIPSDRWLWNWYYASIGILLASMLVVATLRLAFGNRFAPAAIRWSFWSLAFLIGALGTTLLSRQFNDFVFTWQVSLFVALMAAVDQVRFGSVSEEEQVRPWRARLIVAGFIACCVGYFLICRRLGLVFEWVFLCGFAAALPVAIAGTNLFRERRWQLAWQALATLLAFTCFYWSSAAILWWKGGSIE